MTDAEYIGRSHAIELEMARARLILDEQAIRRSLGSRTESDLIKKAHADWDAAVERYRALEREYWGTDDDK